MSREADLRMLRREVRLWVRDVVAVRAFGEPEIYAIIDRKALVREAVESVMGHLTSRKAMVDAVTRVGSDREEAAAAELAARRLN